MKKKVDEKVKNLCDLASKGLLPHAVLLETEDIGKEGMKSALYIAKTLVCRSEMDKPCGKCIACKKIDLGAHPDVQIISVKDGYKSIRVDDVRSLRLDAYLAPNESSYKIYIIDDGSLMNEQAQNVLLKILEEPPERVKFIILCQSRFSMLITVRSRVQIFEIGEKDKSNASPKVKEIVYNILTACVDGSDFEITKSTSKLVKDKETFKRALNQLDCILSEMCKSKAKGEISTEYEILNLLSLEKLILMRDSVIEIKGLLDKNVNNQLVVCKLCIKLRG